MKKLDKEDEKNTKLRGKNQTKKNKALSKTNLGKNENG